MKLFGHEYVQVSLQSSPDIPLYIVACIDAYIGPANERRLRHLALVHEFTPSVEKLRCQKLIAAVVVEARDDQQEYCSEGVEKPAQLRQKIEQAVDTSIVVVTIDR